MAWHGRRAARLLVLWYIECGRGAPMSVGAWAPVEPGVQASICGAVHLVVAPVQAGNVHIFLFYSIFLSIL